MISKTTAGQFTGLAELGIPLDREVLERVKEFGLPDKSG